MPSNYYENLTNTQQPTTNTQNQASMTPMTPTPEERVTRQQSQQTQNNTAQNNMMQNNTIQNNGAQNNTMQENTTQQNTTQNNNQSTTSDDSFPDNSTGRLRVSVFTANQLSPVAGATVTVSTPNGETDAIVDTSVTDRSGSSVTFTLPAPNASFSQEPTAASPFAVYQVSVSHPDFYEFIAENVQVFGGIVTQLPVNLIPLPELPNGETTKIVIIPNQNL